VIAAQISSALDAPRERCSSRPVAAWKPPCRSGCSGTPRSRPTTPVAPTGISQKSCQEVSVGRNRSRQCNSQNQYNHRARSRSCSKIAVGLTSPRRERSRGQDARNACCLRSACKLRGNYKRIFRRPMVECRRPAAAARLCGSNDIMTVVGHGPTHRSRRRWSPPQPVSTRQRTRTPWDRNLLLWASCGLMQCSKPLA
jgi:hypothetical protein